MPNRFTNRSNGYRMPGLGVTLPFFAHRVWLSIRPRRGGAASMTFDSAAMLHDPSITWIGHSTFLVRMDGVTFLTDPMFSERASPFRFMGPKRLLLPGVPLEALPPINFVLLSHDHYDHADHRTVQWLARRGVRFIVPLGMRQWVEQAGGQATELDWWRDTDLAGVTVHSVPAQHFSGRSLRDRFERLWTGWIVAGPTRRFYHVGDTGYSPEFKKIGELLGPVDLATLPIGAYLPAEMMQPVHVTPEEALQIAQDVKARRAVAMHFGTFDLADEELEEPPHRFRAEAERICWGRDRAWIMRVGETREW